LAQALTPLLPVEQCREALSRFEPEYGKTYAQLFRAKLGLRSARDEDPALLSGLLEILRDNAVDYPMFFRTLSDFDSAPDAPHCAVRQMFEDPEAFDHWGTAYRARLFLEGAGEAERKVAMRAANPRYVLRNWLAQRAIDRAQAKDFSEVDRLLDLLRRPFDDQPGFDEYARPAPADVVVRGVSCSS
ncbi:MAG: protein adenylyltransferase SelO family protein, partial [Acidobacteriota bacterium]